MFNYLFKTIILASVTVFAARSADNLYDKLVGKK